jgi:hypothetical protein
MEGWPERDRWLVVPDKREVRLPKASRPRLAASNQNRPTGEVLEAASRVARDLGAGVGGAPAESLGGAVHESVGVDARHRRDDVRAVACWDPDGAGPATPVWVFGGEFSQARDLAAASRLAVFDPATR